MCVCVRSGVDRTPLFCFYNSERLCFVALCRLLSRCFLVATTSLAEKKSHQKEGEGKSGRSKGRKKGERKNIIPTHQTTHTSTYLSQQQHINMYSTAAIFGYKSSCISLTLVALIATLIQVWFNFVHFFCYSDSIADVVPHLGFRMLLIRLGRVRELIFTFVEKCVVCGI